MGVVIKFHGGDDYDFGFTVFQGNGVDPEDITGATFVVLAKRSVTDLDADAVITGTAEINGDPAAGGVAVSLPAADTAAITRATWLWFEIQMTKGGKSRTVLDGKFLVQPQIVRA